MGKVKEYPSHYLVFAERATRGSRFPVTMSWNMGYDIPPGPYWIEHSDVLPGDTIGLIRVLRRKEWFFGILLENDRKITLRIVRMEMDGIYTDLVKTETYQELKKEGLLQEFENPP